MKNKIIRVAALSDSLRILLKGQLKFLNGYFDVIGVGSGVQAAENLAAQEGIETIPLQIERKISPFQDIRSLYKLYRLFRKEKPFIVHSITPKAGLLSMLASYLAKVPHRAHTFTGLVFPSRTGFMQVLLIFFNRIICYCATDLFPEGQGVKQDLIKYKITKKPLQIIANGNVNGINLQYFDPSLFDDELIIENREKLGIPENDFIFLFVGRLVPEKGITELIDSFLELTKNHNNIKLILVGSYENKTAPLPSTTMAKIKQRNVIIETGFQHDVRPFFAMSNVFVFPSYREGFPNVVLQSSAMGKFSIVTDINGSNEIIKNGINGNIIAIKNQAALQNAMLACLENRTQYKKYDPDFRQIITENYEQSIVWNATLMVYEKKKQALFR